MMVTHPFYFWYHPRQPKYKRDFKTTPTAIMAGGLRYWLSRFSFVADFVRALILMGKIDF
jgi:hypothetical protein